MSILLIDSYDSFTYNLRHLVENATGAHVLTIHNDSYDLPREKESLNKLVGSVDAIVIGPGPGNPDSAQDVGIIPYLFETFPKTPILGICLGFQCLCLAHGCTLGYLEHPVHGQISRITPIDKNSLFRDFDTDFDSVRYHSIYISTVTDDIIPLAYSEDQCLMAAKHAQNLHFGVQYHPESVCSEMGSKLVSNFWALVEKRETVPIRDSHLLQTEPLIKHFKTTLEYDYKYEKLPKVDILSACERFPDPLLLNSALSPGEWSIIGLPEPGRSLVVGNSREAGLTVGTWKGETKAHSDSLWSYICNHMSQRYYEPTIGDPELAKCPFVGGFIGFLSYEESIPLTVNKITSGPTPSTRLCFVERFIVSNDKHTFVVSIRPRDKEWIQQTKSQLQTCSEPRFLSSVKAKVEKPDKKSYEKSFYDCQKYLHAGDSYELCLTRQTKVHVPKTVAPWELYKCMVKNNPSPYSCYLDFGDARLLSTSPERFLSWNNQLSQMRPIKGTVKKHPQLTYARACELLKIPKEIGENLMIVDLIRHDLYQMLKEVEVTKLMSVEEYQTVYQLVSVIEGRLQDSIYTGIDLLRHSLPPGSMTGAPKKRSVEILCHLEDRIPRGLYSGVCGYWSVNNHADWSVIIRSLFNYEDDLCSTGTTRCFRCGAGGAITVLSTCEGEWDELNLKLDSVLGIFS
ncbi:hypothetical protein KL930_000628 [Ogataea haglerorum]|nr:hypothetical protein KL950_000055 [Ogataea haglerorum]KAG7781567.1 hypothetical protein KL922_000489 [Ogataea haglerorum]KAG7782166.1 hypothetical protein KL930_000628 [Ogataea haglerorum]KAG7815628.1 hypothetical protein KL924_000714 [Ogataea haglerorum]